jgi:hypothetical protein
MIRCPIAISLGWHPGVKTEPAETPGLHTRCMKEDDGHYEHGGHGLAQFEYQTLSWLNGDRRTYKTEREDIHAWEIEGELTVTPEERAQGDAMIAEFFKLHGSN